MKAYAVTYGYHNDGCDDDEHGILNNKAYRTFEEASSAMVAALDETRRDLMDGFVAEEEVPVTIVKNLGRGGLEKDCSIASRDEWYKYEWEVVCLEIPEKTT